MMSCSQYDYIEIACLYHLPVRLKLLNGAIVEGTAVDTTYTTERKEAIVIATSSGHETLPTESLQSMQALAANPHFDQVTFTQIA
ncbi:Rho-binding antiterminator [Vibrio sp. V39_P1S14PM300]|uniref:Rho-binding antiterminator n=1 Tax=Vibrio sp. V39_P1S14PM300 TaxID=1938690 RepID=UPI0013736DF7|nr:Rho-binding antiterminator [Vibrio sp. V39_P1S14PM300]NAX20726.1 transcriptional antiterminator [Vibrio sp. V39_P1S14PM300]